MASEILQLCDLQIQQTCNKTRNLWCHVARSSRFQNPIGKLQTVTKFPLGHSSLPDIRAIYAYIFWSLLFSPLSHAQLPFSLKRTSFRRFSFYFGGFRNFAIMWSSDPYLKYFQGVHSVCLLSESPAARAFSFPSLILLNFFSAEWLVPPQKVHFVWTLFALSIFLPKPDLL